MGFLTRAGFVGKDAVAAARRRGAFVARGALGAIAGVVAAVGTVDVAGAVELVELVTVGGGRTVSEVVTVSCVDVAGEVALVTVGAVSEVVVVVATIGLRSADAVPETGVVLGEAGTGGLGTGAELGEAGVSGIGSSGLAAMGLRRRAGGRGCPLGREDADLGFWFLGPFFWDFIPPSGSRPLQPTARPSSPAEGSS